VGVASGLDALALALRALDIGAGDEVIVPSNTFIATWLAVSSVGARPTPVDPDPATHNIDPEKLAASITPHTRAIVPVHLYGQPAELAPILEVAKKLGLAVIEDAAQAHGARYRGRRIGAHSDIVCWSFYPAKNLGAVGDGGAITTDRTELADRVRLLRNYGSREKYRNDVQGWNSRLDPIQAAVLRVKLGHLDRWTQRRRHIAERYLNAFCATGLTCQHVPDGIEPAWHLFVMRSKARDVLQTRLEQAGIQSLVHYPIPPHMQPAYADLGFQPDSFPVARQLAGEVLSLPIGPHLPPEKCDEVIHAVLAAA
jgi:dTDP-4-amino-4,6-dideoxygalactose transaminase